MRKYISFLHLVKFQGVFCVGDILSDKEKIQRLQAVTGIETELHSLCEELDTVSRVKPRAAYIKSLTAYRETLTQRINELEIIRNEITKAMYKVSDSVLQAVLIKRYIEGKTWESIADEMFFSSVHIQQSLHPKALAKIELKNV